MSMDQDPDLRQDSVDRLLTALADVGVATILTDNKGRVLFINLTAESLTGWPRNEAVGLPVASIFQLENESSRRFARDPVTEVLLTGTPVPLADRTVLIARDGTDRRIDHGAAPVRDSAGAVAGVLLFFCDASERQREVQAVEDALAFAMGIIETVREPLLVLNASLQVEAANRSFYETFRMTPAETEGRHLDDIGSHQWRIPRLRGLLEETLGQGNHFQDFEVDQDFAVIGRRVMVLNARQINTVGERPSLILLAIEDVTERRKSAEALAASELRYRRLFETAQDGILLVDPATRRVFDANPFLTSLLGYTRTELVGKELWEIGLFRDIESNKSAFETLLDHGYIRYEDLPLRTSDGREIEVEFVSNVYDLSESQVIQCNIRDITDRKKAENSLRAARDDLEVRVHERTADLARTNEVLTAEIARRERSEGDRRDLQQRLTTAQEEERRRIARELHDQMGQHLAALGLGLKVLKDAIPNQSPAHARLQFLQSLTDQIGRELHHVAVELRPTALDDLGLRAAMANYAESWSERAGIEVDFHATGVDGDRLPAPIETALYRIVQEALTNVFKHAHARRVSVVLLRSPSQVSAVVEDDGQGFDTELTLKSAAGRRLGILGMRERAALVGGSLVVESAPGRGTTVIIRIPLPDSREEVGDD